MLSLSGIACDDIETDDNGTATLILTSDSHNHAGDIPESDGCSPFCVCQCCQTHFDIPVLALKAINVFQLSQDKSDLSGEFFPNGIIYSIWRPPQSA
jgi:hypothetical protein